MTSPYLSHSESGSMWDKKRNYCTTTYIYTYFLSQHLISSDWSMSCRLKLIKAAVSLQKNWLSLPLMVSSLFYDAAVWCVWRSPEHFTVTKWEESPPTQIKLKLLKFLSIADVGRSERPTEKNLFFCLINLKPKNKWMWKESKSKGINWRVDGEQLQVNRSGLRQTLRW